MDFPSSSVSPPSISTLSSWAATHALAAILGGTGGTSAVWPGANRALFIPVVFPGPFVVQSFFCSNGAAVAGNIDMGLYGTDGSLIVSTGSTAQAGTSVPQILTVTAQLIPSGRYYLALSASSTSATFISRVPSVLHLQRIGILQAASQVPLATLPTWATPASAYLPWCGISQLTTY